MKQIFFSILLMLICWGCGRQKNNSFIGVTVHCDTLIIHDTLTEIDGGGKVINIGSYHLVATFTPVFDSAAYWRKKYKKFLALYTNSIGYKEVTRMGDSCRRYYQLLNRKK